MSPSFWKTWPHAVNYKWDAEEAYVMFWIEIGNSDVRHEDVGIVIVGGRHFFNENDYFRHLESF